MIGPTYQATPLGTRDEEKRFQELLNEEFKKQVVDARTTPQISAEENAEIDAQIASQQQPVDPLMQYQQQIAAARQAEIAAQQEMYQKMLANDGVSTRFMQPGQSFMDAIRDPSKAQRAGLTNFGLQLMASSPTDNLSARLGKALGSGLGAMTTQREKQLTREQQLSKLNLAALKSKREAAEKGFGTYMQVQGEKRSQAGEVRSEAQEVRNQAQEVRSQAREARAEQDAINARADRAYTISRRNLEEQRGNLTPAQVQTNQSIVDARGIVTDALNNGVTKEQIAMMQRARVQAEKSGLPESEVASEIARIMEGFLGGKTVPNILYNRPFMDALETASKPLFDAGGKRDYNARAFLDIITGSPEGSSGPSNTGTPIPAPKNITRKMVTDLAAQYRKQNPSLTQAEAEKGAEAALRNR